MVQLPCWVVVLLASNIRTAYIVADDLNGNSPQFPPMCEEKLAWDGRKA